MFIAKNVFLKEKKLAKESAAKKIQAGKINGLRKYDKADYWDHKCYKRKDVFWFTVLMDIKGNTLTDHYAPDLQKLQNLRI